MNLLTAVFPHLFLKSDLAVKVMLKQRPPHPPALGLKDGYKIKTLPELSGKSHGPELLSDTYRWMGLCQTKGCPNSSTAQGKAGLHCGQLGNQMANNFML